MNNDFWADDVIEAAIVEEIDQPAAPLVRRATDAGGDMLAGMGSIVEHARHITRDRRALIAAARTVGGLLGKDGFYRFPTGGTTVCGPSIALAQALAQEWGGIIYDVSTVDEREAAGGGKRLHLRARVLDLKSLVSSSVDQVVTTSAPPGKFAAKLEQQERWHTMQMQAAASKIIRNAIFRVLPDWLVTAGMNAALEADNTAATGGMPLPEARQNALRALASLQLTQADAEAIVGQPVDLWAGPQLSILRDVRARLKSGEISVEQLRSPAPTPATPASQPTKGALGVA